MAVRISNNNNTKRLIIDGVNRYKALVRLGAKNILIQEFDYFRVLHFILISYS